VSILKELLKFLRNTLESVVFEFPFNRFSVASSFLAGSQIFSLPKFLGATRLDDHGHEVVEEDVVHNYDPDGLPN
jgi:hypothetical protein